MKETRITEFVEISLPETTTVEQFTEKAENFVNFLKKQDGFIDGEMVQALDGNVWRFVFHFENMEKVKAIGEKMRAGSEFAEFKAVIAGFGVSFFQPVKRW
ncbi:MAG: hypothetical protein AB7S72_09530 [Draconibacterium sp.]